METYEVTLWLDNGVRQKRTKFKIEVQPDTDISEAAISKMPDWIVDESWEIADSKYKKLEA
jgi:hypothetical protein